jgi:predicted DNA-binding transcriptional regulator AlpA
MQNSLDRVAILCEDAPSMIGASIEPPSGPTIQPMVDEWMTVREAMEMTGRSRSRIYALKNSGQIQAQLSGGILKLRAEDVRRYADREKKPGWPRGRPRSQTNGEP